jgi:hypothetical protein
MPFLLIRASTADHYYGTVYSTAWFEQSPAICFFAVYHPFSLVDANGFGLASL